MGAGLSCWPGLNQGRCSAKVVSDTAQWSPSCYQANGNDQSPLSPIIQSGFVSVSVHPLRCHCPARMWEQWQWPGPCSSPGTEHPPLSPGHQVGQVWFKPMLRAPRHLLHPIPRNVLHGFPRHQARLPSLELPLQLTFWTSWNGGATFTFVWSQGSSLDIPEVTDVLPRTGDVQIPAPLDEIHCVHHVHPVPLTQGEVVYSLMFSSATRAW